MKQSAPMKANIENIHKLFESKPNLVNQFSEKGSFLHDAIGRLRSPQIVGYLLCRGKDVVIDGIDCSVLTPMNLSIQNSLGENAFMLAKNELSKTSSSINIKDIVEIKLINNFIKLAQKGNFEKIAHKVENYKSTYNAEVNIYLTKPRKTDIATEPTESKVRFRADSELTEAVENAMPHYPSFDDEWKEQNNKDIRRAFITAYTNNNYSQMQDLIHTYNIKFKGSDTVSELAYKAIDYNCLHMTYDLLIQGSATPDYIPEGKTKTLKDSYNFKKAEIAADMQVKRELANALKRPVDMNIENKDLSNSPPKKSKSRHSIS